MKQDAQMTNDMKKILASLAAMLLVTTISAQTSESLLQSVEPQTSENLLQSVEPKTAASVGPIVDYVNGNSEWEFTEAGDRIFYVNVNDVENYYNFDVNFGAYTNTDWFIVDPSISYQLTEKPGTRKYRLKITYNPHETNTVYEDVLTLRIFDTTRNVIVASTSIKLKGDAVASVKGSADTTGVTDVAADSGHKDGKYIKDGKVIIVKGNQEFDASGAGR